MRYLFSISILLASFYGLANPNIICNNLVDVSHQIQDKIDNNQIAVLSSGTCIVGSQIILKNGSKIHGSPDSKTVLVNDSVFKPSQGMLFAYSSDKNDWVNDIVIKDLTIKGGSDYKGFSEHVHLISLHGVSNVIIHNVNFISFQGDGVYIGGGIGNEERHNKSIYITSNSFDGVNNSNRNGVSVIDGENIYIINNVFTNVAKSNMPGAIDIEPNLNKFHFVKNVVIGKNKIINSVGYAAINIWLNDVTTNTPSMFYIYNNKIFAGGKSRGINFEGNKALSNNSPDNNVIISSNIVRSNTDALVLRGVKKFKVEGNIFISKGMSPIILNTSAKNYSLDGEFLNNRFNKNYKFIFSRYFNVVSEGNCFYCVK
ncbi:hypothetical protein [Serratia fonticola]